MKYFATILMVFGNILIFLQLFAYMTIGFLFPPTYQGPGFWASPPKYIGTFVGHNFIGLLGLLLIIISIKSNSKTGTSNNN